MHDLIKKDTDGKIYLDTDKTLVHEGKEVKLTGRIGTRRMGRRKSAIVEIQRVIKTFDFTRTSWVDPSELYAIMDTLENNDEDPLKEIEEDEIDNSGS